MLLMLSAVLVLALQEEADKPEALLPIPEEWAPVLESIAAEDLQRHVNYLASDELQGRHYRSEGARKAAAYIAKRFEEAGLEPAFVDAEGVSSFFQPLEDPEISPNVAALRPGTGEGTYCLTAHYDHLAPRAKGEDRIYNGADDNASGVSALLEIARALDLLENPLESSLLLVAFTGEEVNLCGAAYFVKHPPLALESFHGVLNMDMISRGREDLLFVETWGKAPLLEASVRQANRSIGLDLQFDRHAGWLVQGDHFLFVRKGVPTVYFGVEDHEDYHKVSDHADRILAPLLERTARLALLTVLHADAARTRETESAPRH